MSWPVARNGNILGVVVTYHPDESFPGRIASLTKQIDSVLIVDNHSSTSAVSMLRETSSLPNVRLILNSENLGIAAALNIGVKVALASGFEWVATFDQDSSVPEHYFDDLLKVYRDHQARTSIAILAPVYCERAIGNVSRLDKDAGIESVEVDRTMTSGSLIRTDCFRSVGLFDESLYIDYVDHEFGLRLIRAGYRIVRSNNTVLLHRLGNTTANCVFGRTFYTTGHDSTRRYYIARNRMLVYRRYATFKPLWIVRDIASFFKEIVKIAIAEQNSVAKLSATVRGVYDGLFGRTGSL